MRALAAVSGKLRELGPAGALMLAGAYALKRVYSGAGAGQLEWVLAPSCWLARELGGVALAHESGAGWISHSPRMVVGTACAGVNFLIVAWLALYFGTQDRCRGQLHKLGWLVASALAAYGATLVTNGLRISLAAQLYGAELQLGWLSPARLHRLLGVVLYCTSLFGLCRAAELWAQRGSPLTAARSLAPFYWYAGVVVGVPLANRALLRDPGHFIEHAVLSLVVGLCVVLLWQRAARLVVRLCSQRLQP